MVKTQTIVNTVVVFFALIAMMTSLFVFISRPFNRRAVSLELTEGTECLLSFNFSAERAEKLKLTSFFHSYIFFCRPLSGN